MRTISTCLVGAWLALSAHAHGDEVKETRVKVEGLHPTSILGKTGVPIGTLTSFRGVVIDRGSSWFEVTGNFSDGAKVFVCRILRQHNPPKPPKTGERVQITGFEELIQIGHHSTVSEYLSIRQQVLEAAGLTRYDPPGGPGGFKLDTQFWVVEVMYLDGLPRGQPLAPVDMRGQFELMLRDVFAPVAK